MQIRIANRQDEKKLVPFVEEIYNEFGVKLDLASVDSDLKNVEANYFGKDGVFLLAEEEQKVIGIAGAHMVSDDLCALRRIYVAKGWRRKGIGRQMLNIVVAIAKRFQYKKIVAGAVAVERTTSECGESRAETKEFLCALSFRELGQDQRDRGSFELNLN